MTAARIRASRGVSGGHSGRLDGSMAALCARRPSNCPAMTPLLTDRVLVGAAAPGVGFRVGPADRFAVLDVPRGADVRIVVDAQNRADPVVVVAVGPGRRRYDRRYRVLSR